MLVLDIHSQGNIREHIAHLQAKLGDMTEPLASIGMELESRISARFESRTDQAEIHGSLGPSPRPPAIPKMPTAGCSIDMATCWAA